MGWLALPYVWLPKGASTISLWWAGDTFQQCSREAPETNGMYWLPTATDIENLERRLLLTLDLRNKNGQLGPSASQKFRRQYIGFTRNGKRLIYANFSRIDESEPWPKWPVLERPVVMCDGGASFWGIVYDPKTGRFEEPQFNGVA
jgi:hypothetical protein